MFPDIYKTELVGDPVVEGRFKQRAPDLDIGLLANEKISMQEESMAGYGWWELWLCLNITS